MSDYTEVGDEDKMPFGRYKGRRLENVPASYLLWLLDDADDNMKAKYPALLDYIDSCKAILQDDVYKD